MRAAIEFFGLEWVGDNKPVLEQVGPLLGAILVAGVAAFAAGLAASTANKRQQKQLDQDAERQREQLTHDRDMRDRDFLRQTVSSVLENGVNAIRSVSDLEPGAEHLTELNLETAQTGKLRDEAAEDRDAQMAAVEAHLDALKRSNEQMTRWRDMAEGAHLKTMVCAADNVRIRSLLGDESRVKETHWDFANAIRLWFSALSNLGINAKTDELVDAKTSAQAKVGPALAQFEEACREELRPTDAV